MKSFVKKKVNRAFYGLQSGEASQTELSDKGPVSVSCKQNPVWFGHWALFVDNRQFLPNELGL